MINMFLDSNIWLDLYYYSGDDLEQFSKLNDMIGVDVNILLTKQVKNEVERNRENKIRDAMKPFKEFRLQFPNLCKGYPEYFELNAIYSAFQKKHKEIIKKIEIDIENNSLHADNVIKGIFKRILPFDHDEEILKSAILRYKVGNPPGKENSYGDAINWELILMHAPYAQDFFFVSSDKDYRSIFSDKKINPFLLNEWKEKKSSDIFLYTSLSMFLNEHIKDINLKSENEKSELVRSLSVCMSFTSVHAVIEKLSKFASWTCDQCITLFNVAIQNRQVYYIITDTDVSEFYHMIARQHLSHLHMHTEYKDLLGTLGMKDPNSAVNEDIEVSILYDASLRSTTEDT